MERFVQKALSTLLILFFAGIIHAQNGVDYQNRMILNATYICKQSSVKSYYSFNSKGLSIYKSPQDKKNNKPEFYVPFSEFGLLDTLLNTLSIDTLLKIYANTKGTSLRNNSTTSNLKYPQKKQSLKGAKIAIDPGHIANTMQHANLEGKSLQLSVRNNPELKEPIELMEGRLTFGTALLLKEMLQKEGAEVMLTRDFAGKSSFNASFEEWLNSDSSGYKGKKLSEEQLKIAFMKKFNNVDLINRVKKINNFNPDLTIVIHYNVDENNSPWTKVGSKNFTMTFIGGALWENDMDNKRNRFHLMRMLLSNDLQESEKAASHTVIALSNKLDIPIAKESDASYLTEKCLKSNSEGVYPRNLALTRLVLGPLVYGEALYQDNKEECIKLSKPDFL